MIGPVALLLEAATRDDVWRGVVFIVAWVGWVAYVLLGAIERSRDAIKKLLEKRQ